MTGSVGQGGLAIVDEGLEYPRSWRDLEVWNGAIAAAAAALLRSAQAVADRPLSEGQTANRRRLTIELIESLGDEIGRLAMTAADLREAEAGTPDADRAP